jgi:acetyl-CoA acetyltransferase
MRTDALVVGVGMTTFGKHLDRSIKSLAAEAVTAAITDAGIAISDVEVAFSGNAVAGVMTGQEMIRGQVVLRPLGFGGIPIINVENACATGSTALHQACRLVTAGVYDVALVVAFEKLYDLDKQRSLAAYGGGVDVEHVMAMLAQAQQGDQEGGGPSRSVFMDFYASAARAHMEEFGTTVDQMAGVSVKNSVHGSLNPRAQFREALTLEDVLRAPMIAPPLTRPMCSPIGDGAAATIVMSPDRATSLGLESAAVRVAACELRSGRVDPAEPDAASAAVRAAYEAAGLGPEDLDVVELHDASAPAEIIAYSTLGMCGPGEGGKLISDGSTRLGGRVPVNTSGGLLRKGHPIGASGLAQIVELTDQLRGRAGDRQVSGAGVGLAHNAGGTVGEDVAAACITILQRHDR